MNQVRHHFKEIIKAEKIGPPWARMILCALATGIPLLVGEFHHTIQFSIYGALIGFLLSLNDHHGEVKHRLWVTTLTFALMMAGYVLGFFLRGHTILFELTLGAFAYWLGVLGGEGAELERGVLFSVLGVVLLFAAPPIPTDVIPIILDYCTLGFATLFIGIPILKWIQKNPPEPFSKLRRTFELSLTLKKEKHIHAACYVLMTLVSLSISDKLQIERGYWITMTVLLVMRAERTQSVYKTLQRLFGTALGVLACDIVGQLIQNQLFFLALIILAAFIIPWALKQNYLYASFIMTIMIVFIIELSMGHFGDLKMPYLRLQATLIGCGLSLFGTGLSKAISYFIRPTSSDLQQS